jgi:ABC-type polysaccharide/polyol phosphate export permease
VHVQDAAKAPLVDASVRVYRPVKRRLVVADLWRTAPVARMIGLRDIKVKYKQAALGPLWLLIAPLGLLLAITIAFSGVTDVPTGGVPYMLFALVGLTVWTFVQLSASLGSMAIVANGGLVRRSPLPRLALITGSLLGNAPPVTIMLVVALVGTLIAQGLPLQILLLPVLLAWLIVFTLGLTLALASVAARFRDTVSVIPLVLQAGIFVSPVGYSLEGAPKNIHLVLTLNPVSGLIEAFRWVFFDTANPDWTVVGIAGAMTVVLATVGWYVFTRFEPDFADYV